MNVVTGACGVVAAMLIAVCASSCAVGSGDDQSSTAHYTPGLEDLRHELANVWRDQQNLDIAHEQLRDKCIRDRGIVTQTLSPAPPSDAAPLPGHAELDRWLLPRLTVGPSDGLRTKRQLNDRRALEVQPQFEAQEVEAQAELPPGWQAAAFGRGGPMITFPYSIDGGEIRFPIGGCHAKAIETLYGVDAKTYYATYWSLPRESMIVDHVLATSSIEAATEAYARCMRDAGLTAEDPGTVYDLLNTAIHRVLRGQTNLDALRSRERAVFTADETCKRSTGVQAAFVTEFLEQLRAALEASVEQRTRYETWVSRPREVAQARLTLARG